MNIQTPLPLLPTNSGRLGILPRSTSRVSLCTSERLPYLLLAVLVGLFTGCVHSGVSAAGSGYSGTTGS